MATATVSERTETDSADDRALLLKARLYVARLGENDVHRWWRTDAVLGDDGAFVGPRVLPKTHGTARARIAFAVARHACLERYPDAQAKHLFHLEPETEDRLDAYLVERLDAFDWWAETLSSLESIGRDADSAQVLLKAGLIEDADLTYAAGLKLGPNDRSLPIRAATAFPETLRRLVAGFARSQPGALAVPYLVPMSA